MLLTFLTSLPRGPGRTPSPSGTSLLKRLLRFVCLFVISYVISSLFQVSKPSAAKPSADKPAKAKVRRAEYLKPMSTTKPGVWHKVAGRSSKVCLFVISYVISSLFQVAKSSTKPLSPIRGACTGPLSPPPQSTTQLGVLSTQLEDGGKAEK